MRGTGAERPVRAMKSGKLDGAKGSRHPACPDGQPRAREEPSSHAKPFNISKWVVWEAYIRVKANHGAAGVDAESVEMFEQDLKNNLYKIWNRMSSGTYFPPPVRSVGIPKKDGSERRLGIPTVADRIAQTVVKMYLEPDVEPQFHPDSYGYRPQKSAIDALRTARQRCWRYDWVIDLDIRGFFDNLDHALVMRAVRKYTRCRWILLYVQRWLTAPMQQENGTLVPRTMGTPQGGVASPLLANIFLHLAFDDWMRSTHPDVPFERYADDIVAHCRTETQAQQVLSHIKRRLAQCRLEVHPEKTHIVYCKDDDRPGQYPTEQFTFLGYTFRARRSKNRWGKYFINFAPAVSSGSDADATSDATSAPSSAKRQGHRRPGPHVESCPSRVDSILRPFLQIGPVSGLSPLQWPVGSMGHAEIQEATATSPSSQSLARWPCSSRAPAVRPLASAGVDAGGWMMGAV